MLKKVDIDKINNKEVTIYVETADSIMKECLFKAGQRGNGNAYNELSEMIDEQFSGNTPDAKFLRNLNDKIKKLIDPYSPDKEMKIYARNILILSTIADVGDYEVLKKKYVQSLIIPVMYTSKPWSFFSIIRVPLNGTLKQTHVNWEYIDCNNLKITGNVIDVNEFIMRGDRQPLWVEVKYNNNGQSGAVYFAEHVNQTIIPTSQSGRLLSLFQKLKMMSN